jgi:hypothetical protein
MKDLILIVKYRDGTILRERALAEDDAFAKRDSLDVDRVLWVTILEEDGTIVWDYISEEL